MFEEASGRTGGQSGRKFKADASEPDWIGAPILDHGMRDSAAWEWFGTG
jgi:hypothetical protein